MNTTERKADVLAVIDDVTNNILIPNGGAYVDAMNEARTTVAELIERERIMQEALQRIARHTKNITGAPDMVAIAENGLALAARVQVGQ